MNRTVVRIMILMIAFCMINAAADSGDSGKSVLLEKKGTLESGKKYIFQYPSQFAVSKNREIFILDRNQILQLNSEGILTRNYFKKGQGPGEFLNVENIVPGNKYLMVHQATPNKIAMFDFNGNVVKELRPDLKTSRLLFFYKGKYYFLQFGFDGQEVPAGKFRDTKSKLFEYSPGNSFKDTGIRFAGRWMSERVGQYILSDKEHYLFHCLLENRLICSGNGDYKLEFIDIDKYRKIKTVNMPFVRSEFKKAVKKERISASNDKNRKYHRSIQKLLVYKNKILVITSSFKTGKGLKVNMHNIDGDLIKSFHLPLIKKIDELRHFRRQLIVIDGDYLFKEEEDEEGNKIFSKYYLNFNEK